MAFVFLGLTVLILGMNWPLLAIGLDEISPLWFTTLRLAGATAVVFAFTSVTGRLRPPIRGDAPVIASVGFIRLTMVMVLVFTALQVVPPGRSAVLTWTASLWTVPMAAVFLGEHMTRHRWFGLALGITGIVVLAEPWAAGEVSGALWGYALLLAASVIQAGTAVHARGHRWVGPPISALPWQLLAATIPITLITLVREGIPHIEWTMGLVAIVVYQGTLATGFAVWAQMTVLRTLPAVTTNLTMMMVPVIGLVSSVMFVDEQATVSVVTGLILIATGVILGVVIDRKPVVSGT